MLCIYKQFGKIYVNTGEQSLKMDKAATRLYIKITIIFLSQVMTEK